LESKRNPNIANVTLNKYIQIIQRIIKYNLDEDLRFEKLPEDKKIVPILKHSTINKVFIHYQKHIKEPEMLRSFTLFKLLFDTGLRINEALSLKVGDIDFENQTIHVKVTKTKVERFVFFTTTTENLIKQLIAKNKNTNLIFKNSVNGQKLKADNILKICYRLQKRLELKENIRPHKWRHTFATNFLKNGGNLETLRLILGHSNLRTTQLYLHIDKEHLHKEYFRIQD